MYIFAVYIYIYIYIFYIIYHLFDDERALAHCADVCRVALPLRALVVHAHITCIQMHARTHARARDHLFYIQWVNTTELRVARARTHAFITPPPPILMKRS